MAQGTKAQARSRALLAIEETAMTRMTMKVSTSQDKEYVVLQLEEDGKALGHILFDGATAEKHCHDVASHRANLNEPVTPRLDPGARLPAVVDPAWLVPNERDSQGYILCFRHPGLGWLSFVLPDNEAASIAEWLTKDLPIQPETLPSDP
jgi:hypothetical protein